MTLRSTVLASNLTFTEAPRWRGDRLWFSDFYDHAVKTVTVDGHVETMLTVAGQPSGLGWLPDGRLLVVSMGDRQVLRLESSGELVTHADLNEIASFHCNDMVVDRLGRAYVGNFGYDIHALESEPDSTVRRLAANLAFVDSDGTASVACGDMRFANGMVIADGGRTLIVAESDAARLTAFDIGPDGTLSGRRPWADLPGRAPDGICLDAEGRIWVADALSAEALLVVRGGRVVDTVTTTTRCFACALGGDGGTTLFLATASSPLPGPAKAQRGANIESVTVSVPSGNSP
jgi:sugar lactone lactonase YvrE